jgi:hypothetical protein
MRGKALFLWVSVALFVVSGRVQMFAAAKIHVIVYGKWQTVQWAPDSEHATVPLKIRPLIVDGKIKEYVVGSSHEVTDRLFVVRRMFRMNDSLPQDSDVKWQWQRGEWLAVDRVTGRISPVVLPEFDSLYSAASWYRDYVAYCGIADSGKKTYAMVAQLSRRKPLLKKAIATAPSEDSAADAACPLPVWQRNPTRVSFEPASGEKQTFAVHGQVVDLATEEEDGEGTQ